MFVLRLLEIVEFNDFRLRVVKDFRVFQGVYLLAAAVLLLGVAMTDTDSHGNLLQVVQRIEELANDDDRLHAEVCQETNGDES